MRFQQMYYQVYYRIKTKSPKIFLRRVSSINKEILDWKTLVLNRKSFNEENGSFTFLNLEKSFETIDWNYIGYGKLWTYNLNYFDFLNQENLSTKKGLTLIEDYVKNKLGLQDGLEPYTISLRGINWIKFLSINKISNLEIDRTLSNHYQILNQNLEYHLLGNHLLENAFSLLFGSYYFKDERMYKKASKILKSELKEQILIDGAHFELSPMYHQLILFRLLDCINLATLNKWRHDELLNYLIEKAVKMLSWLQTVTYKNGDIPMVNDSAYGIAPTSAELFDYANTIGLSWEKTILKDSGYRKFNTKNYECFLDVGNIGPDYIPGHAHADTFSFELYVKKKPVIVDMGTSTYQKNDIRLFERSTQSHNTILVNSKNQSDVWDGFRVGERAKITKLIEKENEVIAAHDGYKKIGVTHKRSFKALQNSLSIEDKILGKTESNVAYFHLHPSIKNITIAKNNVVLSEFDCEINFSGESLQIEQSTYKYAVGFNKTKLGSVLQVSFKKNLKSTFLITQKRNENIIYN